MSSIRAGRPSVRKSQAAAANATESEDLTRINFVLDRELRNEFKAWCAKNDTSIKDELTRHIRTITQKS